MEEDPDRGGKRDVPVTVVLVLLVVGVGEWLPLLTVIIYVPVTVVLVLLVVGVGEWLPLLTVIIYVPVTVVLVLLVVGVGEWLPLLTVKQQNIFTSLHHPIPT